MGETTWKKTIFLGKTVFFLVCLLVFGVCFYDSGSWFHVRFTFVYLFGNDKGPIDSFFWVPKHLVLGI